jgi:hypothetical protein
LPDEVGGPAAGVEAAGELVGDRQRQRDFAGEDAAHPGDRRLASQFSGSCGRIPEAVVLGFEEDVADAAVDVLDQRAALRIGEGFAFAAAQQQRVRADAVSTARMLVR